MDFDWNFILTALPSLMLGAKMTLLISILGLLGGLIIDLITGFTRIYSSSILNNIALIFIELIRETPIVV